MKVNPGAESCKLYFIIIVALSFSVYQVNYTVLYYFVCFNNILFPGLGTFG